MSDQKDILRIEARRHRARTDVRHEDPARAAQLFFEHISPQTERVIAAYWPKGREFDTYPLLEKAQALGHVCALPVIQKDSRVLRFAPWAEGQALKKGPYDILEPEIDGDTQFVEPDIVVVPLLAFDRYGTRLGHGGGYYDATLADLRAKKPVLAVGFAYAQQACLFKLPKDEHDAPLHWVITPQEALDFGQKDI